LGKPSVLLLNRSFSKNRNASVFVENRRLSKPSVLALKEIRKYKRRDS
jgi:hypothetical protein